MKVRFYEIKNNGAIRTESEIAVVVLERVPMIGEAIYFERFKTQYRVNDVVLDIDKNEYFVDLIK